MIWFICKPFEGGEIMADKRDNLIIEEKDEKEYIDVRQQELLEDLMLELDEGPGYYPCR